MRSGSNDRDWSQWAGGRPVDGSPQQYAGGPDWQMPNLRVPKHGPMGNSPGLRWKGEYSKEKCLQPRVLMIEYLHEDLPSGDVKIDQGTTRVAAQEIHSMGHLKSVFCKKSDDSRLRVLHVQNWREATKYLCHIFHLHDGDDLTGQPGFVKWLMQDKPQRRGGRPLMTAKTWKVSSDPWRGVTKCAAGMDYMKLCNCEEDKDLPDKDTRVLGLMGYDRNDTPVHRYEVYSQRISIYVQQHMPELQKPNSSEPSPYRDLNSRFPGKTPVEQLYDNGNTIIIFDNSETKSIQDTLLRARGDWESRWRRLPFYLQQVLPHDQSAGNGLRDSGDNDELIISDCMKVITQDVFKALSESWAALLDASWEHVSILEDKIYEQPADESRAPELWRNAAQWVKFEKLMFYHIDCVNNFRSNLVELDGDMSDEGLWLRDSPDDFERLSKLIDEDLKNRTADLSDLMYKSVGIRDSRQSLELGASMWRLSWVTFIFLPLTFISGFFGMNVDTFQNDPSIKWYFIAVFPFMITVLIGWYVLKHLLGPRSIQQPGFQRGEYEALFTELQQDRPDLFSRQGPRDYVHPTSRWDRLKWQLIRRWTAAANVYHGDDRDIDTWQKIKNHLVKRWTREIRIEPQDDAELGNSDALVEGLQEAVGVETAIGLSNTSVLPQIRRTSEEQDLRQEQDTRRNSDVDSSAVLVEERKDGTLRQQGDNETTSDDSEDQKSTGTSGDLDEKRHLQVPDGTR